MSIVLESHSDLGSGAVLARQQGISKISSYGENVFIEFIDENKERVILKSRSKDDDIIATAMGYLKK